MQVEFTGIERDFDFEAVILCHLMAGGFNKGIVTTSIEYAATQVMGSGALCIILSDDTVDITKYEVFQNYTPIIINSVIIWSFDCVQIKMPVPDITEAVLNPALQDFIRLRYGLKPYEEGVTIQQSKGKMDSVVDAIIERMVESARNSVLTAADELRMIDVAIRCHRNQTQSLIEERISVEAKAEQFRKLFSSDKEFQDASLKQVASRKINELRSMYESGALTHFEITPREFKAVTKPVQMEYPDDSGIFWPMGKYIIHIPLQGTNVSISQPENMWSPYRKESNRGSSHPHVGNSSVCWGEWASNKIHSFMENAEFGSAIVLILQWLENYNPDSPIQSMSSQTFLMDGKSYYDPNDYGGWYDPRLKDMLDRHNIEIKNWHPSQVNIDNLMQLEKDYKDE